jgi:putative serine protease PepD
VLAEGAVQHSWLGIEGTDVAGGGATGTPDTTLATEGGGTQVMSVVPDSPAARGGLASGDVIVALDGEAITRMPDLLVRLRSRSPGEQVDVTVTRADGSRVTLVVTLTAPPLP